MAVIKIQFISDFVCAVTKRNLDAAIALYQKTYPGGKDDTFDITWAPYYLNYNPYPHSIDKLELANERLADQTPEQRATLNTRMTRAGKASGIHFNWGGTLGPNPATRLAHQLVRLAGDAPNANYDGSKQTALVEALFEAYHCRAQDISQPDVLREAAQRAEITSADINDWLQRDQVGSLVDQEAEANKGPAGTAGNGVPTLIIQGTHRPEGIPDAMDLMEIFIQVREVSA
ncbi:hypothetical protein PG993_006881 [Apiospora rasikravindrae]|uniref:DSBA-like thioredoxin domain-containing protein n=1 Tax=Apiospora rasikravindrae TaxID=990691 RepID=A0ABR1SVW9_9PEZI